MAGRRTCKEAHTLVSDDATPIDQNEVEKLLSQAREGGPPATPPEAPPAEPAGEAGAALDQSEIEALFAGGGAPAKPVAPPKPKPAPAAPAATAAPAASTAAKSAEGMLDKAEQALASVDAPPAELPPGVKPFEFRALGGRPASTDAATLELLRDVQLDLKIELGRTHMQLEEVLQLKTGAVVTLDKLAGDPVDVYVNGRLIARGEVLVMNDNFCVRVAELVAGESALF
jgi:flagellar motor switch protein FliN/FliY